MTNSLSLNSKPLGAENEIPLGYYGMCIMDNMKANHPIRYLSLAVNGKLQSAVKAREEELVELKLDMMAEIQKKFPRPQTLSFLQTASYTEEIALIVEPFIHEALQKAI